MASGAGGKGRFWGADAESSGESSSEDASVDGEAPAAAPGPSKFAAYESDTDSDEGGTRVARSAKERVIDRCVRS